MLKTTIIAVGKLKERAFVELEQEYLKRLRPYAKVKIIELPEVPYHKEKEAGVARRKEAEKIIKRLNPDASITVLDERGELLSTAEFSRRLAPFEATGREIIFIIGSSTGLDKEIKKRANWLLALSPLTFTHNFARVILEEQLYRALTLSAGKIYHK